MRFLTSKGVRFLTSKGEHFVTTFLGDEKLVCKDKNRYIMYLVAPQYIKESDRIRLAFSDVCPSICIAHRLTLTEHIIVNIPYI